MTSLSKGLAIGVGAMLICAGYTASAQESSNSVIGPPQLKEFSLEPRRRIVTQPTPQSAQPEPRAERPAAVPSAASSQPRRAEAPAQQRAEAPGPAADSR